jgi:hypothetical protein
LPSISPDGKWLIQVQVFDRSSNQELRSLIRLERQVVMAKSKEEQSSLQYSANELAKSVSLYAHWSIVHLGGAQPSREVFHASHDFNRPLITWSADSRQIAFVLKDRSFVVAVKP